MLMWIAKAQRRVLTVKLVRVMRFSQKQIKRGVVMTVTFKANTLDAARLPKLTLAWNLYGAGIDDLGRSEPKQDSGFFVHLGANNETHVSTNT